MKKPYGTGIIVGRFQTFHNGHKDIIDKALELCERIGVFIGSSQESGTSKNPYSYEIRESILKAVYGDRIEIYPLPDIGAGNVPAWGDYVLKNAVRCLGEKPGLMVSGKEPNRVNWFDSDSGQTVSELFIAKTVDISATEMRDFLINGEYEEWKKFTPPVLWGRYEELRQKVIASRGCTETSSV